jgi:hypothetical protein
MRRACIRETPSYSKSRIRLAHARLQLRAGLGFVCHRVFKPCPLAAPLLKLQSTVRLSRRSGCNRRRFHMRWIEEKAEFDKLFLEARTCVYIPKKGPRPRKRVPFSFASNETASITSASLSLTDRAILLVQTHPPVGCISLVQRFLLKLGSKPPWCADKFSSLRRQQDLSPMSESRLIKLSKSRIFWARHSRRHGAQ